MKYRTRHQQRQIRELLLCLRAIAYLGAVVAVGGGSAILAYLILKLGGVL